MLASCCECYGRVSERPKICPHCGFQFDHGPYAVPSFEFGACDGTGKADYEITPNGEARRINIKKSTTICNLCLGSGRLKS